MVDEPSDRRLCPAHRGIFLLLGADELEKIVGEIVVALLPETAEGQARTLPHHRPTKRSSSSRRCSRPTRAAAGCRVRTRSRWRSGLSAMARERCGSCSREGLFELWKTRFGKNSSRISSSSPDIPRPGYRTFVHPPRVAHARNVQQRRRIGLPVDDDAIRPRTDASPTARMKGRQHRITYQRRYDLLLLLGPVSAQRMTEHSRAPGCRRRLTAFDRLHNHHGIQPPPRRREPQASQAAVCGKGTVRAGTTAGLSSARCARP